MLRPNVNQKKRNVFFIFLIKIPRQCEITFLWYSYKALTSIALWAVISCLPLQGHIIQIFSLIFPLLTRENHKWAFFPTLLCLQWTFKLLLIFHIYIYNKHIKKWVVFMTYLYLMLYFSLHCAEPYLLCLVWYNYSWIPHLP